MSEVLITFKTLISACGLNYTILNSNFLETSKPHQRNIILHFIASSNS